MYTLACGGEDDLDVTALMESQGLTCRPTSIASFKSDCCSVAAFASESQASCSISTAEDGAVANNRMLADPATTSGGTDVAAMAEVSVIDLLCIYND